MSASAEESTQQLVHLPPSALETSDTADGWVGDECGTLTTQPGDRLAATTDWVVIDPSMCAE
jgi:hypothetical protein